jgi:TPR repeat protein
VPQDNAEAFGWYSKAADQGDAAAQYDLGLLYEEGQGVVKDYVQAHAWFFLAARQADSKALYAAARDRVASKMDPTQIAEAQRLARDWKPLPK